VTQLVNHTLFIKVDLTKQDVKDHFGSKRLFDEDLWNYCIRYFRREAEATLEYEQLYLYLHLSSSKIPTDSLPIPPARDESLDQHLRGVKDTLTDSDGHYFITPKELISSYQSMDQVISISASDHFEPIEPYYNPSPIVRETAPSPLITKLQHLIQRQATEQRDASQKIQTLISEQQRLSAELARESKSFLTAATKLSQMLPHIELSSKELDSHELRAHSSLTILQQATLELKLSVEKCMARAGETSAPHRPVTESFVQEDENFFD